LNAVISICISIMPDQGNKLGNSVFPLLILVTINNDYEILYS